MSHRRNRLARLEAMEKRLLLAADAGHNFLLPADVNNDQAVRPSDALAVINQLAREGFDAIEANSNDASLADQGIREMYYDVNDDGSTSPNDALGIINHLARESGTAPASHLLSGEEGVQARMELEIRGDGSAEFEVRIVGASSGEVYEILVAGESLGEIQINSRGRGEFERNYSAAEIPAALLDADATTNITIGDLLSGPIGDLAHVEWSSEDDASDHDDDDLDEGDDLAEDDDSDEDDHLTDEDEDDQVADDDDDSTDDHTGSIDGDADESSELEIELSLSLPGFPRGKFELQVKGGPEDAVLDISVDGELIGQLATNASGNGELELEFDHENAAVPDVLNEADADTRITIGDVFDGLLAELQSFERRTD